MKNIGNKVKLRILYFAGIIVLVIFVLCPLFFFFYLFDASQVKQQLVLQFASKYHVSVVGAVRPKLWHGLSFEADDLIVTTTASNATLLKIKTISGAVSWLDLIIGHYDIKRLSLNGVELNETNIISNNAYDIFAWSPETNSVFSSLHRLDVTEISSVDDSAPHAFKDGTLHIRQHLGMVVFHLSAKLAMQNTFVLMQGKILDNSNNILRLGDFSTNIYNQHFRTLLTADASYHIDKQRLVLHDVNGDLHLREYLGHIGADVAKISLNGIVMENVQLNLHTSDDFMLQDVTVISNHLAYLGYKIFQADTIHAKYSFNFNQNQLDVNSTLKQLQVSEDSESIISHQCANALVFSSPSLPNKNLTADLTGVCAYNLHTSTLGLNLSGSLNQAPLQLSLSVIDRASKPQINVKGNIDTLDLSRLHVGESDKLSPFYADNSPLPFSWLSLFNMVGDLKVKHFALDRIRLNNVLTHFTLRDGTLNIKNLQAKVYGGTLNGKAMITKKADNSYDIATNEEIYSLDLKSLFSDLFNVEAISGLANLRVNTTTNAVTSYQDLHRQLNGQVIVDANHGAFQGVNLNLFAAPQLGQAMGKSTMFEQLQAKFDFHNGVSDMGNVVFYSPYVIATGTGTVDFVNTTLNYALTIKSALPHNKQKISAVVIPVTATGDLFNPTISIQNVRLATGAVIGKVKLRHGTAHAKGLKHVQHQHHTHEPEDR